MSLTKYEVSWVYFTKDCMRYQNCKSSAAQHLPDCLIDISPISVIDEFLSHFKPSQMIHLDQIE